METFSEKTLLDQARRFDQVALAEVFDRYNNGVYYYALRRLGDPTLADDCAADTFSRFLRVLRDGGGPTDHLKAYLYHTAHNWIIDHYRRVPPMPLDADSDLVQPGGDPLDQAEQNIIRTRVRTALRRLPAEQQQVVTLRFYEGWELEEVAASLKKPIGAVKALQHRAVVALRKILVESSTGLFYENEPTN
jgi:RNA polymerase sigma-70 factor, ECF subfamily